MSWLRINWLLLLLAVVVGGRAVGADPAPVVAGETLDIQADQQTFDAKTQIATCLGNVVIRYGDIKVQAAEVKLDRVSMDYDAAGNVRVERGQLVWTGSRVWGNLKQKTFAHEACDVTFGVWQLHGRAAHGEADGTVVVEGATLTSCKDWALKTERFMLKPNGDFEARNVTYTLFGVPVFYLPKVKGNADHIEKTFDFRVAYGHFDGLEIDLAKEFRLGANGVTKPLVEWRSKRGLALGDRTQFTTDQSATEFFVYGLHDAKPASDRTVAGQDYNDRFESANDRFRGSAYHRQSFGEPLTLRLQGEYATDHDLRAEFFRGEYLTNPEPASYADLTYSQPRFAVSGYSQVRLNPFETVVERLPELKLTAPRQQVWTTPLYYESRSTAANLYMNWRDYDLLRPGLADPRDYGSLRLDTVHFLYLPFNGPDWLRTVPRAGVRATYYDTSSRRAVSDTELNRDFAIDDARARYGDDQAAVNYDTLGGERLRWVGEVGAESSFKVWHNWPAAQSRMWDVDGLRHVAEPYVNYTYIPRPSEDKEHLYYFDETDRIDRENFVRVGTRQRLETRRHGELYTFARLENYADFGSNPPDSKAAFGDFGTLAELQPRSYVKLWKKVLVDVDEGKLDAYHTGVQLGRPEELNVNISYLYRDDFRSHYAYSMGSDLSHVLTSSSIVQEFERNHNAIVQVLLPLTAKTRLQTEFYLDLERGTLARQSYELQHELQCWMSSFKVQEEAGAWSFSMLIYLKDLPVVRLGGGM